MNQAKANQAMLKRLLLGVAVMLVFTYGLVALYGKVSDETGDSGGRIAAATASGPGLAHPGALPASHGRAGQGGAKQR